MLTLNELLTEMRRQKEELLSQAEHCFAEAKKVEDAMNILGGSPVNHSITKKDGTPKRAGGRSYANSPIIAVPGQKGRVLNDAMHDYLRVHGAAKNADIVEHLVKIGVIRPNVDITLAAYIDRKRFRRAENRTWQLKSVA